MSGLDALQAQRRLQSEEELLAFQRQFQQGQVQSSTKVVRAVRKQAPAATGEAQAAQSAAATANAAAAPAAASTPAAAPAAAAAEPSPEALVFHTTAGVAERRSVAPPRPTFGGASLGAQRTGFPAAFKADLRPSAATANAPPADASGAPVKKKSLFAQQRDRMLAQQQATSGGAAAAAPAAPMAAAPVVQREVVTMDSMPMLPQPATEAPPATAVAAAPAVTGSSKGADAPLPEKRGIHEENLVKLDGMSNAEIEEAQRELEKSLPPALVAMLRARRGGGGSSAAAVTPPVAAPLRPSLQGMPDGAYPTQQQLNEYLLDADLLRGEGAEHDDNDSDADDDGIDESGERVEGVQERLRLDQQLEAFAARLESQHALHSQAEKLEWSAPIVPSGPVTYPQTVQGYNNDAQVWNSWRVDLEGRFIAHGAANTAQAAKSGTTAISSVDYEDPSNALYHHGDEADRPGYTMREILHLARSTIMSQRTLALQILAKVLARIRANEYDYPAPVQPTPRALTPAVDMLAPQAIPPFAHLLFSHLLYLNVCTLLRLSLDDNRNPAGVLATLHCFKSTLFRREDNELPLLHAQASYKGHERAARFEQLPSLASQINRHPDAKQKSSEEDESGERAEEKEANDDGLSDNARDEEMCARDLVVGLAHMQLLERVRYILETFALPSVQYRANPPEQRRGAKVVTLPDSAGGGTTLDALAGLVLLAPIMHILLTFAEHSPQAASRVFDTPRLKETLVKIIAGLTSIVASGSDGAIPPSSAASSSMPVSALAVTLHTSLLLVGVLCQVHRDVCHFFLTKGALFASLKKLIVIPNGMPGLEVGGAGAEALQGSDEEMAMLLPLSIQSLHLWRVCLAYGLDIEAFMDHFPVLLGIVSRTPLYVQRALAIKAADERHALVGELWLRQLRGVVSVIEGLTLLFTPTSATASTLPHVSTYSAPPDALSFEFSHIVHGIELVLSHLAAIWFAAPPASAHVSLRATLQETLAGFLHLLASYYQALPTQPSCEWALLRFQIEKHTAMCFSRWVDSPQLSHAHTLVKKVDARGFDAVLAELGASAASLAFTNLPQSLPSGIDRPVQQALNVLFALLRWQESLLTNVPRSPPAAPSGTVAAAASADIAALGASLGRVLATSRDLRSTLLRHFFSPSSADCDGYNRISSRKHQLSGMESELLVSLLVMARMEASSSESTEALSVFYAQVLQVIPCLLRTGKQFFVSKLLADVLFNVSVLSRIGKSSADASAFSFAPCKLLHDTYAHFCFFPEELLVSTLLHTSSILTPTLCVPVASAANLIAHLDTSTGSHLAVRMPGGDGDRVCGAWLLNPLKHSKFLQVQTTKQASHTKASTVITVLRYFRALDARMVLFTPAPPAGAKGAHPMAALFLRALMELYLLGSDVFLEDAFVALVTHFQHALLDGAAAETAAARSARFVGVANHAHSTLMFGASITAPGDATIRTQGGQMVKLVRPAEDGAPTTAASAASPSLSHLLPFFDFHASFFPSAVWGASFYPFFKDFVGAFVADSMGDVCFARFVLLLLRQEYATDHRLVIWRECRELLQSLDVPLPLDEAGYLFPYEANVEILQLLVQHIAGAPAMLTRERNAALYRVAIHHVAISLFGWSHVSGAAEMPATERVRRLKEGVPMSCSPDCTRDLMQYRMPKQSSAAGAKVSSTAVAPMDPVPPPATVRMGLLCPSCQKHNNASVVNCTGCAHALTPADAAPMPSGSVFRAIVNAEPEALASNTVLYRDAEAVIVVDRFSTSVVPESHVDCLPTALIDDITQLRAEHVPLLERLYEHGRAALRLQSLPWLPADVPLDDLITAGYNCPVSVKHLHLHMVMPPFKHDKNFTYPRWHSHAKVMRDLRTHGRVILYAEQPNDAEGQAVYDRSMRAWERCEAWIREWKAKQGGDNAADDGKSA